MHPHKSLAFLLRIGDVSTFWEPPSRTEDGQGVHKIIIDLFTLLVFYLALKHSLLEPFRLRESQADIAHSVRDASQDTPCLRPDAQVECSNMDFGTGRPRCDRIALDGTGSRG